MAQPTRNLNRLENLSTHEKAWSRSLKAALVNGRVFGSLVNAPSSPRIKEPVSDSDA